MARAKFRECREAAHAVVNIRRPPARVTKCRSQVMRGGTAARPRDVIRRVCVAREIQIQIQIQIKTMKGRVGRGHVHVFVSSRPSLSVSRVRQYVKGTGRRILQPAFTGLRKRYRGRRLWARGCFRAAPGAVTGEMAKAYIASQDVPPDDGFRVAGEEL